MSRKRKQQMPRRPGNEPRNRSKSWEDREARDDRRDYKRREKEERGDRQLSSLNDFSWYDRYPILTEGAARLPFPYRPGMLVPFGTGTKSAIAYSVPGIMAIGWLPTVGYSTDDVSPVSTVAREIWSRVRSEFSSPLDVDPPDFVPYILALDSIYSYIGHLTRIYSLLDWYSANNHVTPDGLLTALGCSNQLIQSMRENKADFNLGINYLIHQVRKFSAPFDMDLIKRHYWMNANVYTDAPSINSQFYVFTQLGFYKYSLLNVGPTGTGTDKATGAELVLTSIYSATSYKDLLDFGNTLLEAMNTSEDAYTMNGYLMRAYGLKPAMEIDDVPIVTNFDASYQEEVLAQIENASGVYPVWNGGITNLTWFQGFNVWQDPTTNIVYSKPHLTVPADDIKSGCFLVPVADQAYPLSIRSDAPQVKDVVVASRLKTVLAKPQPNDGLATGDVKIISGTEAVVGMYTLSRNRTDMKTWATAFYPTMFQNSDATIYSTLLTGLLAAGTFDWRPIAYYPTTEGNDGTL